MESVHCSDWLQEAHTKQWYCDFGHESTLTFELEVQWREHVLDQAQQKLETGQHDSTEVHNSVVNHVAIHLKSLSLLAIPSLREAAEETAKLDQKSVVFTKGSSKRLLKTKSLPDLSTSRENTIASDIPPGEWPDIKHETVALSKQEGWDDGFVGYRQPDEPPESPMLRWYGDFRRWKGEQDAWVNQLSGKDPVPYHLGTSETQTSTTDVDFQDDVDRTALSLAVQGDDVETMSRLIIMGADIEMADRDGKTPLCWAAGEGQESAVEFLIDKGARIEATDQIYGRTSLSWAAARGHVGVVWVLCTEDAHVDAVDDSNRTPLSWAASRGNEDTLRLLIDAGSDVKSKDSEFLRTPLHWAAIRNRPENMSSSTAWSPN
ncbi:ankyrin repeat-containing domain protein [Fusarium sp. MPI-SDFR-AT-0072]|nr:ankyrin repeat-containing domain protein [Fusarium sp. MPI-SDFR-AT-0072]